MNIIDRAIRRRLIEDRPVRWPLRLASSVLERVPRALDLGAQALVIFGVLGALAA